MISSVPVAQVDREGPHRGKDNIPMSTKMRTLWIIYVISIVLNFILSLFDYLSTIVGFPFILSALMFVATAILAATIISKSPHRGKAAASALILLAVSHYHITGMLFAMLVWKIRGFGP